MTRERAVLVVFVVVVFASLMVASQYGANQIRQYEDERGQMETTDTRG